MGGTSGVILDIFFRACGNSYATASVADVTALLDALQAGTDAITFYGGATEGMRTMLDAMIPAHRAGKAAGTFGAMAAAAMAGAEATSSMAAVAGRAAYVPDSQVQGTPDPGAMAVGFAMLAAAVSAL